MEIKIKIKSAPVIKSLYKQYTKKKQRKLLKTKGELLQKVGDEIITIFFDIVYNQYQKKIWLDYGTLLGAIREKGYIKHDYDIDFGMFVGDLTDDIIISLENKGVKMIRAFWREDLTQNKRELTEVTFRYKDVDADIFFSFKEYNQRIIYSYVSHSIEETEKNRFAVFKEHYEYYGLQEYVFRNIKVLIPENTNLYLSQLYGQDYMTPIEGYKPDINSNPHQEIEDFNKVRGVMIGVW